MDRAVSGTNDVDDGAAGAGYVAMGSSFAAGPGLRPRAPHSPRLAGRSAVNYAHVLAESLGLPLDDRSYSGVTIAQLGGFGTWPAGAAPLTAVGPTTRLVTITGGGNDVGYLPRLTLASLPRPLRGARTTRRIAELGDPDLGDARFAELATSLDTLLAAIRARSDATMVVTDYLTILPVDGDASPLPAELAQWGRGVAARLTEVLSTGAEKHDAVFAAAGEASAGHHAWSDEPWTRGFHLGLRGGAPYHPTAVGMRAVAELVEAALRRRGALPS